MVNSAVMALDPQLLEVIVCPVDRGPLVNCEAEGFLYNPRLKRKYPVVSGIPVLLAAEAVAVGAAEHEQLVSRGRPAPLP